MLLKSQRHDFLFGQISVFVSGLKNPYNKFSKEEYDQGFSYRPESVSFRTPFSSAECQISIYDGKEPFDNESMIVIEVPFRSVRNRSLCVASVIDGNGDEIAFNLPEGKYSLFFEAFSCGGVADPDELQNINLHFKMNAEPQFAVLKNVDFIKVPTKFHTNGAAA